MFVCVVACCALKCVPAEGFVIMPKQLYVILQVLMAHGILIELNRGNSRQEVRPAVQQVQTAEDATNFKKN